MTSDEQTILRTYLLRIGAISSEDDFEEWCQINMRSKKGKVPTVGTLAEARAYDLGLRDAKLQAEAWVEGIDRTYNLIFKGLMAERKKGVSVERTPSPPWLYLPVGPEGPRPWPDST